jgi:hypothetical protein
MSRTAPNIELGTTLKKRDRVDFKSFVNGVITDTFIYQFNPNSITLDETGELFTLSLFNKRFIVDNLQVDKVKDYIDVYLFGVKQPQNRYEVSFGNNNIIVTFTQAITRVPADVNVSDFEIKGKIAEVV